MLKIKFDCKGNNAPAYSCSEPGDQSGYYVKAEEVKHLQEDAKNGSDWFNAYQEVDNFLMEKLGSSFPCHNYKPEQNTIEAIKILLRTEA